MNGLRADVTSDAQGVSIISAPGRGQGCESTNCGPRWPCTLATGVVLAPGRIDGMKKQARVMVDSVCSEKIMGKYRPEMKKFCYDSPKYDTCLEQLGSKYPTVAR